MAKKIVVFLSPILFITFFTFILFKPYFLSGKVPIPGDILIGHYYPWRDKVWLEKTAGYPIKNFALFDGIRHSLPWRLLAIEQIKSGKWPLWNPYIFSGMPLLGNLQVAVLYPLNIFFFFLPPLDAWTVYLFLQPILAGIFTYWFLRTLNCRFPHSLFGGVTLGFSLIMMNYLEFGTNMHTALWLPLILGAINKIQESPKWRYVLVLSLAASLSILGGYPPWAIYNLIVAFLYFLFKTRPLKSIKFLLVFLGFAFAFLLTALQILPAFELAQKVIREETHFGILSGELYFLPWKNLLTIVAPDYWGHPSTGNYFSQVYFPDTPSIGIVGLLFVFYALLGILRNREVSFWFFFLVLSLCLMLETPLGRALRFFPVTFFSQVTPLRMIWIVTFSLVILSAIGMESLQLFLKKGHFWRLFLPIIFLWEIIFFAWFFSFLLPSNQLLVAQRNLALPTLFLFVASVNLIFVLFFPKIWPVVAVVLIFLSGTELVRQGIKYNPFVSKELVFPQTEVLRKIQEEGSLWRTMVTHPDLLPVNSNIVYKIPMVDGYGSLYDSRYGQMVRLVQETPPVTTLTGYPRIVFQTEYRGQVADLLNGRFILSLGELRNEKLKFIAKEGRTILYENKKVFPKAFFVRRYWVEKSDLAIANRMLGVDLAKEVVLEKEPGIQLKDEKGKAEVLDYSENNILVKTSQKDPGILVLTDSFDSGWKAYVDGRETEVLRADYDLWAIVVPAGDHKVKFIYEPKSFRIGLRVSLGSFVMLLIFTSWILVRRKNWW